MQAFTEELKLNDIWTINQLISRSASRVRGTFSATNLAEQFRFF